MKKRIRTKFERAVDSTWFLWRDNRSEMEHNKRYPGLWKERLSWMRLNKKGTYSA